MPASPLSPPFAARELNGEQLIAEWQRLGEEARPATLNECASALKGLAGRRAADAVAQIQRLAAAHARTLPALANILKEWAPKVRNQADLEALVGHFRRLTLCVALIPALRRANERL